MRQLFHDMAILTAFLSFIYMITASFVWGYLSFILWEPLAIDWLALRLLTVPFVLLWMAGLVTRSIEIISE